MLRQICLEKQPRKITGAFRKRSNNNTNIDEKSVKKHYPCYPLANLLRRQLVQSSENDLIVSRKRKSLVEFNLQGYIFHFSQEYAKLFSKNICVCSETQNSLPLESAYLIRVILGGFRCVFMAVLSPLSTLYRQSVVKSGVRK